MAGSLLTGVAPSAAQSFDKLTIVVFGSPSLDNSLPPIVQRVIGFIEDRAFGYRAVSERLL